MSDSFLTAMLKRAVDTYVMATTASALHSNLTYSDIVDYMINQWKHLGIPKQIIFVSSHNLFKWSEELLDGKENYWTDHVLQHPKNPLLCCCSSCTQYVEYELIHNEIYNDFINTMRPFNQCMELFASKEHITQYTSRLYSDKYGSPPIWIFNRNLYSKSEKYLWQNYEFLHVNYRVKVKELPYYIVMQFFHPEYFQNWIFG